MKEGRKELERAGWWSRKKPRNPPGNRERMNGRSRKENVQIDIC